MTAEPIERTRPPSVMRRMTSRATGSRPQSHLALVAAASVYDATTGAPPRRRQASRDNWQSQAWDYYDSVGELRFGVGWVANALSRVNLVAAKPPEVEGDEPTILMMPDPEDPDADPLTAGQRFAIEQVRAIAGGVASQGQLLAQCATQLTVPGSVWIVVTADEMTDAYVSWDVCSDDEVKTQGDRVTWTDVDGAEQEWNRDRGDLLIHIWRQHPRKRAQADSPVRAALPVLRIIDRMTVRQNVNIDSRAAGNGLLLMPNDVEFPELPDIPNKPEASDLDKFMYLLGTVMGTGIVDPTSPSARVPIGVMLPGDFLDKVKHLTFDSALDNRADAVMNLAIRRLALAMDFPPEILLGASDVNHWNMWQVQEEAITLQVEPLGETIVHGLTKGWLTARMKAAGFAQEPVMVWYDTTDLTTRPDLGERAQAAYDGLAITQEGYLAELGLDGDIALDPDSDEFRLRVLLAAAKGAPTNAIPLLTILGYITPEQAALVAPAAPAEEPAAPDTAPAPPEPATGPPDASESTVGEPDEPPAAAIVAAADGLVHRALERVGNRLRAAVTKGTNGGSAALDITDCTTLHTSVEAVDYVPLARLLDGAWDRVPQIALRYGWQPQHMEAVLDAYVRTLILARRPHDLDGLADALDLSVRA